MSKLLITSVIIGILAFLAILFISPFIIPESDLVALVANGMLGLSNAFFENMPSGLASYINNLNLALTASTIGLLLIIGIQILLIIAWTLTRLARGLLWLLQRLKKEEAPKDLPPIDFNSSFRSTGDGKGVLGRGLDSFEQD